ncbi:MAG: DUF6089 family protein [Ginsengibacter sp.]|jgi:opacity protein-like surface antigen
MYLSKKQNLLVLIFLFVFSLSSKAQINDYANVQEGEFGITIGSANYYGDLNTTADLTHSKLAFGLFFRKQLGNYVAVRLAGHYAQLGYSDSYSKNDFQQHRNLSFNTDIYEVALLGDFNFLRFIPGDKDYSFTPYASIGIGMFSYDPYTYYKNEKVYLRQLNTEGQSFYQDRKPYGTTAFSFPIAFGIKYAMSEKITISAEFAYRFTTTDYLDDVSTTYAGINNFPLSGGSPSLASILQDRSYEVGTPIGVEGRQRGFSKQKDQFSIIELGVSINIMSYRCPTAR